MARPSAAVPTAAGTAVLCWSIGILLLVTPAGLRDRGQPDRAGAECKDRNRRCPLAFRRRRGRKIERRWWRLGYRFGQIAAASFSPLDRMQDDLSETFAAHGDFLGTMTRRFLSGYVNVMRTQQWIPSNCSLSK